MNQNILTRLVDSNDISRDFGVPISRQWCSLQINGCDFLLLEAGIQSVREELETIKPTCCDADSENIIRQIIVACDDLKNRIERCQARFHEKRPMAGDWSMMHNGMTSTLRGGAPAYPARERKQVQA